MHVAMVIQRFRPAFGGQAVQVETLCEALAARNVSSAVLTSNRSGGPPHETLAGYEIHRLASGSLSRQPCWPRYGLEVFRALRRLSPDVVHVHSLTDGLYGAWLYCRTARKPLVFEMTLLGVDDPESAEANRARPRWLRRLGYRNADAYVAMSRAFEPAYERAGLRRDRLHLIPQGVDTAHFVPARTAERETARRALGCPAQAPVVVFVGSLIRRKGIDVLLRAWPAVLEAQPDARLLLVGPDQFDDARDEELSAAWQALPEPTRDSVVRTGRVDDTRTALHAADVFAFPSRQEGFGTVIIEAMACGLPCVVAELPGITDYVFDAPRGTEDSTGRTASDGCVIGQDDPEALASALRELLADPPLRTRLGAAARDRVVASFDMGDVAASYADLYEALAGASR